MLLLLQGQLLRTLMETTKAPHSTTREGWLFLFVLLLLALCCCCFVTCTSPVSPFSYYYNTLPPLLQFMQPSAEQLQQELEQLKQQFPRRKPSTWRLLLSLSHIITSVVPPEFPMLLSLTLTVGVLHLAKTGICCTDTLKYAFVAAAASWLFVASASFFCLCPLLLGLVAVSVCGGGTAVVLKGLPAAPVCPAAATAGLLLPVECALLHLIRRGPSLTTSTISWASLGLATNLETSTSCSRSRSGRSSSNNSNGSNSRRKKTCQTRFRAADPPCSSNRHVLLAAPSTANCQKQQQLWLLGSRILACTVPFSV